MNKKLFTLGIIVPLATAGAVSTASSASAVSAPSVSRTTVRDDGDCTGRSDISLEAMRHLGGIRLEVNLETNRQHQWWRVRITQNGDRIFSDTRRTGRDGDLTVRTHADDERGSDHFRATARNLRTGERCSVDVTVRGSRDDNGHNGHGHHM